MLVTHKELRQKNCGHPKSARVGRFHAVLTLFEGIVETPIPAKKPIGFYARLEFPAKSDESIKAALNSTK